MKKTVLTIVTISTTLLTGLLFSSCEQKLIEVNTITPSLQTTEIAQKAFEILEEGVKSKHIQPDSLAQYVCGSIETPKILKDLNRNVIYSSNISLDVNASLSAYGFSGTMGKKDVLIAAYLIKYKDYNCDGTSKRAQVGLKLYVHASDLKIKVSAPSLGVIAAAAELGLAKAEYKFETFGINPDNFYTNLPSAQFSVDTYAKVISAYDNIIHSLNDSTEIDPIITEIPQ
ncbi:MAG: hypothetical protein R3A50_07070 [Saprospiraceae bacterium]|nr:hypothetical protein [Saprospiraceae bacterium]